MPKHTSKPPHEQPKDNTVLAKELLARLPGVAECIVLAEARKGGTTRFVAHVVLAPEGPAANLVDAPNVAAQVLPPSAELVILTHPFLPLTPEGEVDVEALARLPLPTLADAQAVEAAAQDLPGVAQAAAVIHALPAAEPPPVHRSDALPRRGPSPTAVLPCEASPPGATGVPAISHGPPLPPWDFRPLGEILRESAAEHPLASLGWWDARGAYASLGYPALLEQAERVATALLSVAPPRSFVLLLAGAPPNVLCGLWACLLAGLAAAPLQPLARSDDPALARLLHAWDLLGQPAILCDEAQARLLAGAWPADRPTPRLLTLAEALTADPLKSNPKVAPADPALALLTSGSTGAPKAVPLTHSNIAHVLRGMDARFMLTHADNVFNWMALDHVAGLLPLSLAASLRGASQAHAPTQTVLETPTLLLDRLHQSKAAEGFVPNFMFNLVADRAGEIARAPSGRWDLSRLRLLISGGEAVDVGSASRFEALLAPFGLRPGVLMPSFGLSETAGGVSFADGVRGRPAPGPGGRPAADLGRPLPGASVRIVDDMGRLVEERVLGQVEVRTAAMTSGLHDDPEAAANLHEGWLNTGDRGFLEAGGLFLVGRNKDVLIVNAVNYGSAELEAAAEAVPGVAPTHTAAVAVREEGAQTDQAALLFSPSNLRIAPPEARGPAFWRPEDGEALADLLARVKESVVRNTGLAPAWCLPLPPGALAKTSIGKLKRQQVRDEFRAGRFAHLSRAVDLLTASTRTLPGWFHATVWRPRGLGPAATQPSAQTWTVLHLGPRSPGQAAVAAGFRRLAKAAGLKAYLLEFPGCDVEALRQSPGWPGPVLDLRFLGADGLDAPDFLPLAKALVGAAGHACAGLTLVTSRAVAVLPDDAADARRAMLPALLRGLGREAGLATRHVDLDADADPEALAAALFTEASRLDREAQVVWRGGRRLAPRLAPLRFPLPGDAAGLPTPGAALAIGGGLGRQGLALARMLLERGAARLLLFGPEPPDESILEPLRRQARECGGEVLLRQADPADPAALERGLGLLPKGWPTLEAVFLVPDAEFLAPLARTTPEDLARLWRGSALAAENLLRWAEARPAGQPVRLCALCAAPEALPVAGASALAAADAAMRAVFHDQALTVDCAPWAGSGLEAALDGAVSRECGLHVLSEHQARQALEALLPLLRGPGDAGGESAPCASFVHVGLDQRWPALRARLDAEAPPPRVCTLFYAPETTPPSVVHDALTSRRPFKDAQGRPLPLRLVPLAALPLAADGGPDRARLLALAEGSSQAAPPSAALERLLSRIWRECLDTAPQTVDDNFFLLGGDSLRAAQMMERMNDMLGLRLPLAALFANPSIAAQRRMLEQADGHPKRLEAAARRLLTAEAPAATSREAPPALKDRKPARLSPGQRRLWLLHRLEGPDSRYNNGMALRLRGRLDHAALERALGLVVDRHEPLRTVFREAGAGLEPVPEILPPGPTELPTLPTTESDLAGAVQRLVDRPFDLAAAPPMRFALFQVAPEDHCLALCIHHCASDGWSFTLFLRELESAYRALTSGLPPKLPPLASSYARFADCQRDNAARQAEGIAFWRERLKNAPPLLSLPLDSPRSDDPQHRALHHDFVLPPELTERLRRLAAGRSATLAQAVLTGFAVLLSRYAGQTRLVMGLPVANRPHADFAPLIGFFVNTLALPLDVDPNAPFAEVLGRTATAVLDGLRFEDTPFDAVVEAVNPDRSARYSPLFQVMFAYQSMPHHAPTLSGLATELMIISAGHTAYDLTLSVEEDGGGLACRLTADAGLFRPETAARLAASLRQLLEAAAAEPTTPAGALNMLALEQRRLVLEVWQGGPPAAPAAWETAGGLAGLFLSPPQEAARDAVLRPDAPPLPRAELRAQALDLAWRLSGPAPDPDRPGDPLGLLLPRSERLARAMAAALLARRPFAMLDPAAPIAHLALAIAAGGLRQVVAAPELAERLAGLAEALPCLADAPAPEDFLPPGLGARPDETAYLAFTSGSTGRPKIVLGTHRGLLNRLRWQWAAYPYRPDEVCCLRASPTFVDSLAELLGPLLAGVPIAPLGDAEVADPRLLLGRLAEIGATRLLLAPSLLAELLDAAPDLGTRLPRLLLWSVSGEKMPADLLARFRAAAPRARLLNLYGSSEVGADATWCECGPAEEPFDASDSGGMPIGRPLPGCRAYVLDERLAPAPPGVSGVLHVAGEHLALGYRDDPERTAAAFLPEIAGPLAAPGGRMFRTGDIARFRHDGLLEYLGRDDFMITLHGLRVEPGEVEACLRRHPAVRGAVAARAELPGGAPVLAAWIVPFDRERIPCAEELLDFAAMRLPRWMLPSRFLLLERLPLLPSGKLDRRGLPLLRDSRPLPSSRDAGDASGDLPGDADQRLVAEAVAQVLGRPPRSAQENFFTAGGNSLLAMRLAARLGELSGRDFPVAGVFAAPSVAGMARQLRESGRPEGPALAALGPTDDPPLAPAQRGFWIRQQLEGPDPASVVFGAFHMRGRLDPQALRRALSAVLERHLPLRTLYGATHGEARLRLLPVDEALNAAFHIEDLAGLDAGARREHLAALADGLPERRFDLTAVPPLDIRLALCGGDLAELFFCAHHIAWDGWSARLFFPELAAAYTALVSGKTPDLPALPVSYHDFAAWTAARERAGLLAEDLAWWRAELADAPQSLDLPTDFPRPEAHDERAAELRLRLEPDSVARLHALARDRGGTLHSALLAALAGLLHARSGRTDLVLGLVSAGRPRRELHGLVGFFANVLPLRLRLDRTESVAELLDLAREGAAAALAHQEPPTDLLVQELRAERQPGRTPLLQTLFAHQDEPFPPPALPGLKVADLPLARRYSAFDLVFETQPEADGGLNLRLAYATSLFAAATAERLGRQFLTLCRQLAGCADARQLWRGLSLSDAAECEQLRRLSSGGGQILPEPCLVHEAIRARALANPDATALDGPLGRLTRGELESRAAAIAARMAPLLADAAAGGDRQLIALCCEPGPDYVAGWLGVLKAGAAVLPLDPAWPVGRAAAILAQMKPTLLAAPAEILRDLALPKGTSRLNLADVPNGAPPALPASPRDGRSLAYVIATSGTTGEPKAVAVEHRSLANLALAQAGLYGVDEGSRALLLVSPAFDVAMGELATLLMAGGVLVLAERRALAPGHELVELLAEQGVTHLSIPPSALAAMPWNAPALLPTLRTLVLGGECCPEPLARRWGEGRRLFNAYGPTEATVCATAGPYRSARDIGRPLPGVQALVLDADGRPLPLGAPGELCLAGTCLARGYLGRAELTSAAFVTSPLAEGGRVYRTGDRARWREDGGLEFLGRLDDQLKIRGVRVEPAEIAAALEALPGVLRAAAGALESAEGTRLAAWYVPEPGTAAAPGALLALLRERLPAQAVPERLLRLDALPLTANGKIDMAALPKPDSAPGATAETKPGRAGGLRAVVAGIWGEVLGRVPDEDENFFDAGGHSLLLARVQALIEERCGRRVSTVDLFRHPTIRTLAASLGERGPVSGTPTPRTSVVSALARTAPIAVVGMACRAPGAPDLESFWQALRQGRELLSRYTDAELLDAGEDPALLADPAYVRAGGFIKDIDCFDAAFFGLSPHEAADMDPQQRVFLECAWHALEHAGHAPASLRSGPGLRAAVFAGSGQNRYLALRHPDGAPLTAEGFTAHTGNAQDFLASRVAYLLNLTGPAVAVQTACSTSLTAVALACQTLRQGAAEMALAGGVSLPLFPRGYLWREGLIFSPDGHCRPFDAGAGGTVPSGGCGVVVLRPLEDALAAGDLVHAVILGAALNNDGAARTGYTAPGVDGQAAVIRAALDEAGVAPEDIGLVEAHGTGTVLGDPIEVAALRQAYDLGPPQRIALGSAKANLGHADAAAGVLGLIKAVLCLEHGEIAPTPHFTQPNPRLELESGPFRVPRQPVPWPAGGRPRHAAVSAFGIGGTNAHVVLEEGPIAQRPAAQVGAWRVLPLSAATPEALNTLSEALAGRLEQKPASVEDLCLTLARGRAALPVRRALLCRDADQTLRALRGHADGVLDRRATAGRSRRPLLFLLPGQGSQHPGMAQRLYDAEPAFARRLNECRNALPPPLGRDVLSLLLDARADAGVYDTALAQPLLVSLECALAALLEAYSLRPAALLGHSLGELTAFHLAGVLSLEDTLALAAERGRLMAATPPGAMLAATLDETAALALRRLIPGLSLAAVNSREACTLSGPVPAVEAAARELRARGVEPHLLRTGHAFHSSDMAEAAGELARFAAGLRLGEPRLPVYSGLTGGRLGAKEMRNPNFWRRQMLAPARFGPALEAAAADDAPLCLEVGPGRALTGFAQAAGLDAVRLMRHPDEARDDHAAFLEGLARVWLQGAQPDFAASLPASARRVPLPGYPFARQRYWAETPGETGRRAPVAAGDPFRWFHAPAWRRGPAVTPAGDGRFPRRWMLLAGADPLGAGLRAAIERRGGAALVVAPETAGGLGTLLARLTHEDRLPEAVLHLGCLEPCDDSDPERALDLGLFGLLDFARAWAESAGGARCRLGLVTRRLLDADASEPRRGAPLDAAALGAIKVLPVEQEELFCRALDISGRPDPGRLLDEFLSGGEIVTVLRGATRWLPAWTPLPLPAPAAPAFRRNGAYWITGGLGGMGLGLARGLAKGFAARLLLTSRSGLPKRESWADLAQGQDDLAGRIRTVLELEALGAEVLVRAADVTDMAAMDRAASLALERFGGLDGVIHAAGLADEAGLARRRGKAETLAVLAPKVAGALNLVRLLRGRAPKAFLALCSSLGDLLPGHKFAQSGYAAANEFLDAVPGWAQDLRVVTVNWDDWLGAGMSMRAAERWRERHGRQAWPRPGQGLTAEQGFDALGRILASGETRVAVSTLDLRGLMAEDVDAPARLSALLGPETAGDKGRAAPRPELAAPYAPPADATEAALCAIWGEALGVAGVGALDDFFELGGHSLLATRLIALIRQRLGARLLLCSAFQATTPRAMAALLAAAEPPAGQSDGKHDDTGEKEEHVI